MACDHSNTKVTDSRRHGSEVNRTRVCRECGYRFYTIESLLSSERNTEKQLKEVQNKLNEIKKILGGI